MKQATLQSTTIPESMECPKCRGVMKQRIRQNGNSENRALIYRSEAALSTLVTKSTRNFISRRLGAAAYEDQR